MKSELRGAFRLPIKIKFKYNMLGPGQDENITYAALTKNISCNGLLFENTKEIPLDTQLKIVLTVPASPVKTVEAEGRVTRIEKLSVDSFDIGITFVNLSETAREEINKRIERMDIMKLLEKLNKREVSDLHLTVDSPPMVRHYGEIEPMGHDSLSAEEIQQIVYSILSEEQKNFFESNKDLDFALSPFSGSRYRVSIYQQRGFCEVVFRNIPPNIKSREQLGLSDVIEDLCRLRSGLVFISGPTGSGKTTTITTMIDIINKERKGVILSLEKPIEYLHQNIKGIVKQREVGVDVATFASGLKASLRQDADVIVVGEVLDSDTVETALQAAETGHLVITSLHATDTVQVFDRLLSLFPLQQRELICSRLSHSIQAVIAQKLLPLKDGFGRIVATEVCIANTAVKRIIHSGEFTQLVSVMQTGSKFKMHLMRDSIDKLFEQNLIGAETYEMYTKDAGGITR